jgi:Mg2+-importing ATPase
VLNVLLHKPILDALLFSLAIAVGITPQLLPAVVSSSQAAGSRRMRLRKVLVKRLVCIEDLGDVDVLFTDKTGTLTLGRIDYMRSVAGGSGGSGGAAGADEVVRWGLLCTENAVADGKAVGGNPLDQALWASPAAPAMRSQLTGHVRRGVLPFDHERSMVSVLLRDAKGELTLVTKGAPETVLDRCLDVTTTLRQALAAEFAAGNRVVAVATGTPGAEHPPVAADEHDLHLVGLLVFRDPPKPDAAAALLRLAGLGIAVKVVTGDNPLVAGKVCRDLDLVDGGTLTGTEVEALDDARLAEKINTTVIFARVTPEQKARIVRVQRRSGGGVAFLGDGVNDALALHAADVGISVDSGTDVAKDAADVILLEKDLDVLADGVVEGRKIFANTHQVRPDGNLQ